MDMELPPLQPDGNTEDNYDVGISTTITQRLSSDEIARILGAAVDGDVGQTNDLDSILHLVSADMDDYPSARVIDVDDRPSAKTIGELVVFKRPLDKQILITFHSDLEDETMQGSVIEFGFDPITLEFKGE